MSAGGLTCMNGGGLPAHAYMLGIIEHVCMPSNTTVTVENVRVLLRSRYFRAIFSLNLPAAHPSQQADHNGPDGQLAITLGESPTQCQTTTTIPIFGMASRPHPLPHPSTPPPVSALSLSLTCKSLSALASCHGGHTTPSIPDREEFLLLLEKDVGRTHSYCHTCSTLHPFSSSEPYALASSTWKLGEDDCRRRALVFFNGSGITLGYHHVRLAMDRHLFGPPNGLPLSKFNLPLPSQAPPLLSRAMVRQDSAGRVLPVCHADL